MKDCLIFKGMVRALFIKTKFIQSVEGCDKKRYTKPYSSYCTRNTHTCLAKHKSRLKRTSCVTSLKIEGYSPTITQDYLVELKFDL
jgi:hypothetical protein